VLQRVEADEHGIRRQQQMLVALRGTPPPRRRPISNES
jgi:hypothetical protein